MVSRRRDALLNSRKDNSFERFCPSSQSMCYLHTSFEGRTKSSQNLLSFSRQLMDEKTRTFVCVFFLFYATPLAFDKNHFENPRFINRQLMAKKNGRKFVLFFFPRLACFYDVLRLCCSLHTSFEGRTKSSQNLLSFSRQLMDKKTRTFVCVFFLFYVSPLAFAPERHDQDGTRNDCSCSRFPTARHRPHASGSHALRVSSWGVALAKR